MKILDKIYTWILNRIPFKILSDTFYYRRSREYIANGEQDRLLKEKAAKEMEEFLSSSDGKLGIDLEKMHFVAVVPLGNCEKYDANPLTLNDLRCNPCPIKVTNVY